MAGTTALDGVDAGPAPVRLEAVTVKVYESPLVSPATTSGLVPPVTLCPPRLLLVASVATTA